MQTCLTICNTLTGFCYNLLNALLHFLLQFVILKQTFVAICYNLLHFNRPLLQFVTICYNLQAFVTLGLVMGAFLLCWFPFFLWWIIIVNIVIIVIIVIIIIVIVILTIIKLMTIITWLISLYRVFFFNWYPP